MLSKLKPKSEFSRNVLTLMTGSTIAQAIPIAISPILTRIYTPEDFGMFALFMSIAAFGAVAATGRYELAIVLPKKHTDAVNIVLFSIIITFLVSLISLAIVFIFNTQITNLLGNQEISNWLYLLPLTILSVGFYQTLNYWNNRKKNFKRLASNKIIQATTASGANLSFGFFGFGGIGLLFSSLIGQTISTFFLAKTTWKEDNKLIEYINKNKMFALAKKYKKLPLFNLPNALIDTIKMSGISILIAKFFTTATLGQYSLAWKMVVTPGTLVASSLSQVFFQKLASAKKSELNRLVIKFIIKASVVALPMYLIVYFFATDIFIFIFGQDWELAGRTASVLTPWLFLNFISSPLSSLYIILNRQGIMLIISIFHMLVPLSILYLFQDSNFIDVITIVSYAMSIILIFLIAFIIYLTSKLKKVDTCLE